MPQDPTLPPYDTLGPVEVGLIISTFLFEIETLQTFNYYRNYPEDSLALKILVAGIWLLEVGHSICGWHGLYSITITFYGQSQHILDPPQSLGLVAVFSSVLITLVQAFFCLRIGRISGRWLLAGLCFLFSTVPLVGTIAIVFIFHTHASLSALQTGIGRVILVVTTVLQPPAHIIIAAVLCQILWRLKDPEPRELNHPMKMQKVLDKVIIWTIETTLITCFVSLGDLILFLTRQDLLWMSFYLVQSKLLSNTMMASLNRRQRLRDQTEAQNFSFDSVEIGLSSHSHLSTIIPVVEIEECEGKVVPDSRLPIQRFSEGPPPV